MENLRRKKKKLSKKIKNSVRENLYVPVDLLIDIFSRVPAKSIARFRCVSKLWGSILRRNDFTELYLTRSSTCPRILFSVQVDENLVFYSSPQDPNPDEISSVVATRYSTSLLRYAPYRYQTMPCGLKLLQGFRSGNVQAICNPATGEFINIPKFHSKDEKVEPKIVRMCFGHDPVSNQFKVLCMTSSNTHGVLTLETGKCLWRTIESKFVLAEKYGIFIKGEICIRGVLYFIARLRESCKLVCFDVRSEEFSLINIDENMIDDSTYEDGFTTLVNYKCKFGVYQRKLWREWEFDLWVLDDAGNHKWSKHTYRFPSKWKTIRTYKHPTLRVVGIMTGTNELVFAPSSLINLFIENEFDRQNPFYIVYYNSERNTCKRVTIQGFEEFKCCSIHTFLDYSENVKLFK